MSRVADYLQNEKKIKIPVARILEKTLTKYSDIEEEFLDWIDTRSYTFPNAIEVEGYTAMQIHEMAPFMDGEGVYGFLVSLRDDPERALETIDKGFPVK